MAHVYAGCSDSEISHHSDCCGSTTDHACSHDDAFRSAIRCSRSPSYPSTIPDSDIERNAAMHPWVAIPRTYNPDMDARLTEEMIKDGRIHMESPKRVDIGFTSAVSESQCKFRLHVNVVRGW